MRKACIRQLAFGVGSLFLGFQEGGQGVSRVLGAKESTTDDKAIQSRAGIGNGLNIRARFDSAERQEGRGIGEKGSQFCRAGKIDLECIKIP